MAIGPSLRILRCRDPVVVEAAVWDGYWEVPVCYFSRRLVRAAARWLATSDRSYFVVALLSGSPVGFMHCSTMGPHPWRVFARQHLHLLPQLLWYRVLMNQRVSRLLRYPGLRLASAGPRFDPEKAAGLALPVVDAPFAWGARDVGAGYAHVLYVAETLRGQGIGPLLLASAWDEMRGDGVRRVEARIDPGNSASVRAFLKAGWRVVRTSSGYFHASAQEAVEH